MAKNSIFDPTKDGVKADNSGYSSNQIDKMIGQSAAAVIDDDAAGDDTVYSSAKIYSLLPEDTATGAEVTITDACPDLPIVELTANINAVQEGTGDPSPDNVRPISGWDEITITHDDIDVEISLGDNTVYGGTYNSDGTLTVTHKIYRTTGSETITRSSQSSANNVFKFEGVVDDAVEETEICDWLVWNTSAPTASSARTNSFTLDSNGDLYVQFAKSYIADLAAFITWLETNTISVVYPLATPIELTVGTLAFNTNGEGSTIISCDSGDVTVTYKKLTSFLLS